MNPGKRFATCSLLGSFVALGLFSGLAFSQCEEQKIQARNPKDGARFGSAVALSEDVAVVGAPRREPDAVYVFRWLGEAWQQEAELEIAGKRRFGTAAATDGSTLLVGSPSDEAAFVFRWNDETWESEAELHASDAVTGDQFGSAVALAGDLAVVGAPEEGPDGTGIYAGAAYVFQRQGAVWSQVAKLTAPVRVADSGFGSALAATEDMIAAGAPQDDRAGWRSGSVYVFQRDGADWTQTDMLLSWADETTGDRFGESIALDDERLLVGAPGDEPPGLASGGTVFVLRQDGAEWTSEALLYDATVDSGAELGCSVTIAGDRALVGAHQDARNRGAAYLFRRSGTSWSEEARLVASDGALGDDFGARVAAHGEHALIGAPGDSDGALFCGSSSTWLLGGDVPAAWSLYGDGWPGTDGIPELSALDDPLVGSAMTIRLGNSRGRPTIAVLLIGLESAAESTPLGGTLLVVPHWTAATLVPLDGVELALTIACSRCLAGLTAYLQALEEDGGASRGVAFSRGLRLDVGYF